MEYIHLSKLKICIFDKKLLCDTIKPRYKCTNRNLFLRDILKLNFIIVANSTNFIKYSGTFLVFKYDLSIFY
jgi:hypothetical protein